jgi:hypothetical protein
MDTSMDVDMDMDDAPSAPRMVPSLSFSKKREYERDSESGSRRASAEYEANVRFMSMRLLVLVVDDLG